MTITVQPINLSNNGYQPAYVASVPAEVSSAIDAIVESNWGFNKMEAFGTYLGNNVKLAGLSPNARTHFNNVLWNVFKKTQMGNDPSALRKGIVWDVQSLIGSGLSDAEARSLVLQIRDRAGAFSSAEPLNGPVRLGNASMEEAKAFAKSHWADHEANVLDGLLRGRGLYTVGADENLSGIAKSVYGSSDKFRDIFRANSEFLLDANRLAPGWQLVLP